MASANGKKDKFTTEEGKEYNLVINALVGVIRKYGKEVLDKNEEQAMYREGKKCILYPRVSTEKQVDGYSLEGQKNCLKRFAEREEMQYVGIYEDVGNSGSAVD